MNNIHTLQWVPGWGSRYSDSLRAGRSRDRIPVEGEIFRTRRGRPWGSSSLLYNGYRVYFPVAKRPGSGVEHPPPHLAPRLKKSRNIPLLRLEAFTACSRMNFTLSTGLFPKGKRQGRRANHPPFSAAEVVYGTDIHLLPSVSAW